MLKYFIIAFITLLSPAAMAKSYVVDMDHSHIMFQGQHAGNDFEGEFKEWQAQIAFDQDNLASSHAVVTITTKSAETGNAMYDGTIPSEDWFNSVQFPTATFKSTSFSKTDTGYEVTGDLTIRDVTKSMTFPFALEGTESENTVKMAAQLPINRLDFGVGKGSDPSADWVSDVMTVTINVMATSN